MYPVLVREPTSFEVFIHLPNSVLPQLFESKFLIHNMISLMKIPVHSTNSFQTYLITVPSFPFITLIIIPQNHLRLTYILPRCLKNTFFFFFVFGCLNLNPHKTLTLHFGSYIPLVSSVSAPILSPVPWFVGEMRLLLLESLSCL